MPATDSQATHGAADALVDALARANPVGVAAGAEAHPTEFLRSLILARLEQVAEAIASAPMSNNRTLVWRAQLAGQTLDLYPQLQSRNPRFWWNNASKTIERRISLSSGVAVAAILAVCRPAGSDEVHYWVIPYRTLRELRTTLAVPPSSALTWIDHDGTTSFEKTGETGDLSGCGGVFKLSADEFAALEARVESEAEGAQDPRHAAVWPLPGGVREFKRTHDELLAWIGEAPRTVDDFNRLLTEHYDAPGKAAHDGYRGQLTRSGLVVAEKGELSLTARGQAYLKKKDAADLFTVLDEAFVGMLEVLVIAELTGTLDTTTTFRVLKAVLGKTWRKPHQSNRRRNWLLSLGLLERSNEGDRLTNDGRAILAARAVRAAELRDRINPLLEAAPETDADPEVDDLDEEEETALPVDLRTEPAGWDAERLELTASTVTPELGRLAFADNLLDQATAGLSAGKHLLIVGPPGTGKTELAYALARAAQSEGYCHGMFASTASADWTTFDTIGGYALQRDGSLAFREGAFLRAIRSWRWLLIDELNRADVDKAFGELMTVLSGQGTDTAFERDDGRLVSIGPEEHRTYVVPKTFRVVATMNTWDKTSLFRLSYAVQRRFALVFVGAPDAATYSRVLETEATRSWIEPPLGKSAIERLTALFHPSGLLGIREVGPAIPIDIIRYMRRRQVGGQGLAEAVEMYLFPQLEGLDDDLVGRAWKAIRLALDGWAPDASIEKARRQFSELFPNISLEPAG